MPNGDRTGPGGYGSRTGRGLGYCRPGSDQQAGDSGRPVYGLGRGGLPRGGGRGFGGGRVRGSGPAWGFGFRSQNYFRPDYGADATQGESFGSKVIGKLEEILDNIKKRDR